MSKKQPKVVAVDLDGTLLEYDGWKGPAHFGQPIPGVLKALYELKKEGWAVVIWTTRRTDQALRTHLEKHDIPFDYINTNPFGPPGGSHKIYADVYLDDRALRFNGNTAGLAQRIMDAAKSWTEKKAGVDEIDERDVAFEQRTTLARNITGVSHDRQEE